MEYFRTGAVIKQAWEKFKTHFGYLWMMLAIVIVVSLAFEFVYGAGEQSTSGVVAFVLFLVTLLSFFVNLLMQLGLLRVSLDVVDADKKHNWKILFTYTDKVLRMLGASILYFLIVFIGILLLVVPGIYLAIKYQFYAYLILDKDLGVMDSLKKSGEMTEGVKWQLVGFSLAMVGIVLLGILAVVVGLIVAIPVTMLASACVYRALSKRLEAQAVPVAEPIIPPAPAYNEPSSVSREAVPVAAPEVR